jgi:hypothetical protein
MRRFSYIIIAIGIALGSYFALAGNTDENAAGYNCPETGEVLPCQSCCPLQ